MPSTILAPRVFSDAPNFSYICPQCSVGHLVPDPDTFKSVEPTYSKEAFDHEAWDPDWVTYRFTVTCLCTNKKCGEIAFVSGNGSVDQRYGDDNAPEYYSHYSIKSFFPAPRLCYIPATAPPKVVELVDRSFSLYWVDVSAASNALRASLEELLNVLNVPAVRAGDTQRLSLHRRLELWAATAQDYADLCVALKEVGNLGSHGDIVQSKHYLGTLEIYSHVLKQLFDNDAKKMKELAQSIRDEIKAKK